MGVSSISPIRATSFFQETILQGINPQVKKILGISILAFALLGACYLIARKYFKVSEVLKGEGYSSNMATPTRSGGRRQNRIPFVGTPQRLSYARQFLTVEMFQNLGLNNVSELTLDRCNLSEANEFFSFLPENLEKISAKGCVTLGDEALASLPSNLRKIDLTGCTSITDEGIKKLCKACPYVEVLNLAGCIELTDVTASHLSSMSDLKSLSLARCTKITDEGISQLPETIITLVLDDCLGLIGKTFLQLGSDLEELSLDRCLNLDISENEVKQLLRNLATISARDCPVELQDIIYNNHRGENISIQVGKTPQKKKKVQFNLSLF